MAYLSADRNIVTKSKSPQSGGILIDYQVQSSTLIYKGAFVDIRADGFLVPSIGSASFFAGVAQEQKDNSTGVDGALKCRVMVGHIIEHTITSVATSDIGSVVYALDDSLLSVTNSGGNAVGWIIQVPVTGTALVKLIDSPGQDPAAS